MALGEFRHECAAEADCFFVHVTRARKNAAGCVLRNKLTDRASVEEQLSNSDAQPWECGGHAAAFSGGSRASDRAQWVSVISHVTKSTIGTLSHATGRVAGQAEAWLRRGKRRHGRRTPRMRHCSAGGCL